MFEFIDVTMWDNGVYYYDYILLNPGRWNIRDDENLKLAIL